MCISIRGVETHLSQARRSLGALNTMLAVLRAIVLSSFDARAVSSASVNGATFVATHRPGW